MTDDLDALAKGLTKAQREAMLTVSIQPTSHTPVAAIKSLHTFRALERRGLLAHHIVGMVSCARLTPLGLRLRAHLEKNDG